jgi:hypothetical protein
MTVLISIIRSIFYILFLRLRFPKTYLDKEIKMEDGLKFKIFRHMNLKVKNDSANKSIFIVRFKFKKFSHKANIRLSRIPIMLIAGFPGFRDKLWMIDYETDYWQGLYQLATEESIRKYQNSFVLGLMNKRSDESTLEYKIIPNKNIEQYLNEHMTDRSGPASVL